MLAPKGSMPKNFLIHAKRLAAESEYFAGLLRFPGIESQTKLVTLSEGYEGMGEAFDAFVEWIYTGKFKEMESSSFSLSLAADLIVLTERLMAKRFQKEVMVRFESALNTFYGKQWPSSPWNDASSFVPVIRRIYDGVPRPSQISTKERNAIKLPSFIPFNSTEKQYYADKRKKIGYINCRARHLVALFVSRNLGTLRESEEFRAVLEEIGEFACDVVMACSAPNSSQLEKEFLEVIN